jgi:hypothetical protein
MSKGSKRRPQEISDERFKSNWDEIFNKPVDNKSLDKSIESCFIPDVEFLGDIDVYSFFNNVSINECIDKLQNLMIKLEKEGCETKFKCEYIGYDGALDDLKLIRVKKIR